MLIVTKGVRVYKVQSREGKDFHTVDLLADTCDCTGYQFRKDCRHLREVKLRTDDKMGIIKEGLRC